MSTRIGLRYMVVIMALALSACGEETTTGPTQVEQNSSDATLTALNSSIGSFGNPLAPDVFAFSKVVDSSVSEMSVTATAANTNAEITLFGPGLPIQGVSLKSSQVSPMMPLYKGSNNIIALKVRSADGTVSNLYSISITRL